MMSAQSSPRPRDSASDPRDRTAVGSVVDQHTAKGIAGLWVEQLEDRAKYVVVIKRPRTPECRPAVETRGRFRFAPDTGFANSFVGHAGWTIDVNRNLNIDAVIRGGGSFVRLEYSQLFGQHWRVTPGIAWLRGDATDFLGQYHRNSYASLALRYSF